MGPEWRQGGRRRCCEERAALRPDRAGGATEREPVSGEGVCVIGRTVTGIRCTIGEQGERVPAGVRSREATYLPHTCPMSPGPRVRRTGFVSSFGHHSLAW